MKLLITGMAGFIGHAVARRLAGEGHEIVGIDNLNDYYDVSLKQARLQDLADCENVQFIRLDLADRAGMAALFAEHHFERVVHLAAQAGVRYSLENPHVHVYADSNHGDVQVHPGGAGRRAHPGLQPWRDGAGLHLHR